MTTSPSHGAVMYSRQWTTTLTGRIWKPVQCENCNCEFVYEMMRRVQGRSTSIMGLDDEGAKRRSRAGLDDKLADQLDYDFDPVPCPNCGWYQDHMLPKVRSGYKSWMLWLGIVAIPLSIFAAFFMLCISAPHGAQGPGLPIAVLIVGWMCVGVFCMTGPALIIFRAILKGNYHPNRDYDVEARVQEGLNRSLFRDEFEREMAEQRREEERRRRRRRYDYDDDYDD